MKQIISTEKAPGAIGPYSQATAAKVSGVSFVCTSGQLPIDTSNGMLETADIRKATKISLENCKALLEAAGLGLDDVLKTTVFMTDLGDFAAMNEVYATFFSANPPARSCVQVSALPKGAKLEIEMLAFKG